MTPPRTLQEARDAAVDELLRRELATLTAEQKQRFRRTLEAEERRAAFRVVRS